MIEYITPSTTLLNTGSLLFIKTESINQIINKNFTEMSVDISESINISDLNKFFNYYEIVKNDLDMLNTDTGKDLTYIINTAINNNSDDQVLQVVETNLHMTSTFKEEINNLTVSNDNMTLIIYMQSGSADFIIQFSNNIDVLTAQLLVLKNEIGILNNRYITEPQNSIQIHSEINTKLASINNILSNINNNTLSINVQATTIANGLLNI